MLELMQVVIEAFPVWLESKPYYMDPVNYQPVELYPYDAVKALKHLRNQYPDDAFWEVVDWNAELVPAFIRYADDRLVETGSSYELVMGKRAIDIAKVQLSGDLIPV